MENFLLNLSQVPTIPSLEALCEGFPDKTGRELLEIQKGCEKMQWEVRTLNNRRIRHLIKVLKSQKYLKVCINPNTTIYINVSVAIHTQLNNIKVGGQVVTCCGLDVIKDEDGVISWKDVMKATAITKKAFNEAWTLFDEYN